MSKAVAAAPYTLRNIEEMLGLSRGVVLTLMGAGFVLPSRGPRNEYRFTFRDVVLLRTAHKLKAARIPTRRLLRALKQLKAQLPDEAPLSGLRITAVGDGVAVRDGGAQWEAESGQLLMDFDVASANGAVLFAERAAAAEPPIAAHMPSAAVTAEDWFALGVRNEDSDRAVAEQAYRQALALAPGHSSASLNLGTLLCESGRSAEAVTLFGAAIALDPGSALLHFNLGTALEEQHRGREALLSYERCLALDPDLADAHHNAGRLCEQFGDQQGAVRHYSAYRRLERV